MSLANLRDGNVKVAIALAAVAAILTMIYVGHSGGSSTPTASAASSTATVWVAKREIPIGTAGSSMLSGGYVKIEKVTPELVEPDAVTNGNELSGLVSTETIFPGDQITARRFGKSGASGSLTGLSGTGRVMQLAGDPRQLLVGTVEPGDHVDVAATLKRTDGTEVGKIVLHNILVTGVSGSSSTGAADGSDGDWVTLRLTDADARTLFYVEQNGDWTLLLRPLTDPKASANTLATMQSVLGGNS